MSLASESALKDDQRAFTSIRFAQIPDGMLSGDKKALYQKGGGQALMIMTTEPARAALSSLGQTLQGSKDYAVIGASHFIYIIGDTKKAVMHLCKAALFDQTIAEQLFPKKKAGAKVIPVARVIPIVDEFKDKASRLEFTLEQGTLPEALFKSKKAATTLYEKHGKQMLTISGKSELAQLVRARMQELFQGSRASSYMFLSEEANEPKKPFESRLKVVEANAYIVGDIKAAMKFLKTIQPAIIDPAVADDISHAVTAKTSTVSRK